MAIKGDLREVTRDGKKVAGVVEVFDGQAWKPLDEVKESQVQESEDKDWAQHTIDTLVKAGKSQSEAEIMAYGRKKVVAPKLTPPKRSWKY